MMKEGWVCKKLGELEAIVTGNTPSTKNKENYSSKDYCFIKPSDIEVDKINYLLDSEYYISDFAYQKLRKLPKGAVLVTCIGTIGKIGVLGKNATCNQQINAIIPDHSVLSWFLAYAILGNKQQLINIANAPVVPIINKTQFSQMTIGVPPLSEQKRIVTELDKLNEILVKKQEQLKELDRLGQAIFYDMFGDPLYNERYTKVEKLGNVCLLKAGKAIKAGELISTWKEGLCPCYGGNGIRGFINKYSHIGDYPIIGRQGALCGNVNYAQGQFYATEHAVVVSPLIEMNTVWLYYVLNSLKLNEYARGVAQPGISVNIINNITMPIFNINTQIQFAKRIECVESQKQKIKQSIVEVQQLLDYTMNKYFG